jgi:protein MpaA
MPVFKSMRSVYQPIIVPRTPRLSVPARAGNPIRELLAPLIERARRPGSRLRHSPVGEFHHGDVPYRLERFIFPGPPGGGHPIRLGLFAAIHGDEPETALALRDFLLRLDDEPALAQGYEIYAYPVCNPSGFEDGTRNSCAGRDLNREFWRGSRQPEVYFLERELGVLQFAGLAALHADDTTDGAYAYVRGATLTEALAKPALAAAAEFLPLADGEIIDGFPARDGLIRQCFEGVLGNPAELNPLPFEIIFETPQSASAARQAAGAVRALEAILAEYRKLIAYGQNL